MVCFFYSAKLNIIVFRFLMLITFLASLLLLSPFHYQVYSLFLSCCWDSWSFFLCLTALFHFFPVCSPKPNWTQHLGSIFHNCWNFTLNQNIPVSNAFRNFLQFHSRQKICRMLCNWRGKIEDNLIAVDKKKMLGNWQRRQNRQKYLPVFHPLLWRNAGSSHNRY